MSSRLGPLHRLLQPLASCARVVQCAQAVPTLLEAFFSAVTRVSLTHPRPRGSPEGGRAAHAPRDGILATDSCRACLGQSHGEGWEPRWGPSSSPERGPWDLPGTGAHGWDRSRAWREVTSPGPGLSRSPSCPPVCRRGPDQTAGAAAPGEKRLPLSGAAVRGPCAQVGPHPAASVSPLRSHVRSPLPLWLTSFQLPPSVTPRPSYQASAPSLCPPLAPGL